MCSTIKPKLVKQTKFKRKQVKLICLKSQDLSPSVAKREREMRRIQSRGAESLLLGLLPCGFILNTKY